VALVIDWLNRYEDDPFFRVEVRVLGLQALFAVLILGVIAIAFNVLSNEVSSAIVSSIGETISHSAADTVGSRIAEETRQIRLENVGLLAAFIIISTIVFGYIISRITLSPARGALAAQKQFIGNIAHELRTPLSVIKTNSELTLLEPNIPPSLKESTVSNVEELDRISEIINNLLSLSSLIRPEQMEFSSIDLSALVSDTVEKFFELAIKNNVQITVRKTTDGHVWGNMTALQQILSNLIKNAITYTPRGGSVMLTTWPASGDHIELVVRDTGVGIARKDLFRIFEPFYRADPSRSRVQAGSGLGLTIVSELVRMHRGKISVRSSVGNGTSVSVLLPSAPAHADREKSGGSQKINEIRVDYS
jgi:signal transduction histidine kinase